MINGIINVYKEKGYTSHDVVARLRGILHQKKIGHTGTLDPDAEGVLPVCLGKGTKLCGLLTDKRKTYEAVLHLGLDTDTQDISGTIKQECEVHVSKEEVRACMESFVGEQMQIPPMYSARKVKGKKLYELAREGIEVERQPRPVTFYEIRILSMELPFVRFLVTCSKGTYIRTLCHDIGEKLGCMGCMESLLRTRVDRFELQDSLKLSAIEEKMKEGKLEEVLVSVEEMFSSCPAFYAPETFTKMLQNGNAIPAKEPEYRERVRMYTKSGIFVGLYEWQKEKGQYRPVTIFSSPEDFALTGTLQKTT